MFAARDAIGTCSTCAGSIGTVATAVAPRRACEQAGLHPTAQVWDVAPRIELKTTWNEYWAGREKKWRRNGEDGRARLAEMGKIAFVGYRPDGAAHGDGDPCWDFYDACVELARRSWQSGSTMAQRFAARKFANTCATPTKRLPGPAASI